MNESTSTTQEEIAEIQKKYFSSARLEDAQKYLSVVVETAEQNKIPVILNFDKETDFPAGYGLAIVPLKERVAERGNILKQVIVAAIPEPSEVAKTEEGTQFVEQTLLSAMMQKVANSARPRAGGISSLPFSVHDFISSMRGTSGLATFRALAPLYVKALRSKNKSKNISFMNTAILRQCLTSSAFAEQRIPGAKVEFWNGLLEKMILRAKGEGLDTGLLENWLATRESVAAVEVELDLADLDDLAEVE